MEDTLHPGLRDPLNGRSSVQGTEKNDGTAIHSLKKV